MNHTAYIQYTNIGYTVIRVLDINHYIVYQAL